jgi:hypothetical protein
MKEKIRLALLVTAFGAFAIGQGCGGSSPESTGTAGNGGNSGTGGAGTAGGGSGGGGASGSAGGGTGGTSTGGTGGGTAGASGTDGGAGTGGANGGTAGADAAADGPVDMTMAMPDGSMGLMYTFDTTIEGWHTSIYGSTPNQMPNAANNLGATSSLAFDASDDADGKTTSGSLKGTVPFKYSGDRVDFQAFSQATAKYDWTGYVVSAKVKLVSGGNIGYCPLEAWLYVSTAPNYATATSTPTPLAEGSWVTVTFDMADAASGATGGTAVDTTMINQMGIQITTGTATNCPPPDGGAGTDGGLDAMIDAMSEGGVVADAGSSDGGANDAAASDAGSSDGGSTDAGAGDGGSSTDASSDAPPAATATTAVILVDDVFVTVKQ